jgi:phosphotransferase family enzyme
VNGDGQERDGTLPGALGAVRIGSTVRKESGPWTPTIHALLRFLRDAGFDLVPEPLGLDDRGREILSLLDGEAAWRPWPAPLLAEEGVVALARTLRRYHDVVRDFDPGGDACWRAGRRRVEPGEVVCHGDFAPWNTLWRGGTVVGIVDWDMAEPGPPIDDVAFLALHLVPLRSDERARLVGFASSPPRRERLSLLCETYGGVQPEEMVSAVARFHERDRERTITWGHEEREPWGTFLRRGDLEIVENDAAWLREHRDTL